MTDAAAVVAFWRDVGPAGWYAAEPALDARIREIFLDDWHEARDGALQEWIDGPEGALGYLILTDQFPRNMFRDDPRAFATDRRALDAARRAVAEGWDRAVDEPIRQFFYLPFMHAESSADQARAAALIAERLTETGADNLLHARAHAEVIRRFGRFPFRNAALGRESTAAEIEFLARGGYGDVVRDLQARRK